MNKRLFNQYISESNFRELFIREMGWNNPKGQTDFDVTTEETTYELIQIAERSGFQALTCQVQEIPSSSLCKKIDSRLRRFANDYICIFHIPNTQHHLWVVPVKKVEKRDLVLVEYTSADKADFLYDKIERISFDLDERTTIMDVKDRIHEGFIINSEKITKDFYTGFRKEHKNFTNYISGIDDYIDEENKKRSKDKQIENKNKQWYTSVMLNRLMFCYFIQKKGFLDLNINYLKDKLSWVKREKGEDRFFDSFYRGFLVSLFHDGLNSPRHQQDFIQKYGRIPYLNGGMFNIHELEDKYPKIDIADEAFESLFAFFDQWHWHLDDRLTASGKDINPDVLGYIFEQYINDRAKMGAYYTKEDITEYIGRNTIVPFLMDATKKADERPFKTNGEVWNFLKESGDTYIFDAVKKGKDEEIPEEIAVGIDTTKPNLLERRSHWNERAPEKFALPTEIWRETIERLQRYQTIKDKITGGEITEINDFITYNLDIRQFVQDLLAQTDDHLFVKHFYAQLQKVTILDPTCGSGAFLFAALNILEPLYEVCIDRMQDWNAQNPNLFNPELEELKGRYRSNIRYFIYKNIILRNLYGVDIMVEATEIAKLRLFLKMVAVVDVNQRDQNLGLDPLPDIDFNIRCGNTLVGYATEKEMEEGVKYMDMFARQEFEEKVYQEMDIVSRAYEIFKKVQLTQDADLETFRQAKKELKERLKVLNELLNQNFHKATNPYMDYNKWKTTHQPFHWLAEYYDIINGNGGFDVVIGNPPYVEISKNDIPYSLSNYPHKYNDLYGYILYRMKGVSKNFNQLGFIIPISFNSTPGFYELYKAYRKNTLYISCYADTAKMFLVTKRLTIVLKLSGPDKLYTTHYIKNSLSMQDRNAECPYAEISFIHSFEGKIPAKISSSLEKSIISKVFSKNTRIIDTFIDKSNGVNIFYTRSIRNFRPFYSFQIKHKDENGNDKLPTEMKAIKVLNDYHKQLTAFLNSNIVFIMFCWYTDVRNINPGFVSSIPVPNTFLEVNMDNIENALMKDYEANKQIRYNKTTKCYESYYYPVKSKIKIDEIDKVLAKHYGFTEEELDFIINYDIKYRMGDELDDNNESEATQMPQQTQQKPKHKEQIKEQKEQQKEETLTMIVRHETLERIISGEKTTVKRYLDDEEFAKEVLVIENGRIKLSNDYCPYTAKKIDSIKLVCDKQTIIKKVTSITFRSGVNQQGKTAWKIIFHF